MSECKAYPGQCILVRHKLCRNFRMRRSENLPATFIVSFGASVFATLETLFEIVRRATDAFFLCTTGLLDTISACRLSDGFQADIIRFVPTGSKIRTGYRLVTIGDDFGFIVTIGIQCRSDFIYRFKYERKYKNYKLHILESLTYPAQSLGPID